VIKSGKRKYGDNFTCWGEISEIGSNFLEPHSEDLFINYRITLKSIMEAQGLKQREAT
jgi:hypothetical protein